MHYDSRLYFNIRILARKNTERGEYARRVLHYLDAKRGYPFPNPQAQYIFPFVGRYRNGLLEFGDVKTPSYL